ncbi:MAG: tetratricopeptide repeat protein [Ilumatobacteraceae bacterium]
MRERTGGRRRFEPSEPPVRRDEVWVDEGPTSGGRRPRVQRERSSGSGRRREVRALESVVKEFDQVLGNRAASRAVRRYEAALAAFEAFRYDEARRILAPMAKEYADVFDVHDMLGLCLYRGGQWAKAVEELETALRLKSTWIFNHAPLADCHRALGNHARVEELWREVSEASPAQEIMAETRIVMAGSLADREMIPQALELMSRQSQDVAKPAEFHLRQWYVIADLHDRSGNVIEARRFFTRVYDHDAGFADVAERLASLGG